MKPAAFIVLSAFAAEAGAVDFVRDVKPIFERSCFRCHGAKKPKSGFRLDEREPALRGGDNGVAIVPGRADQSPLIHYIRHAEEGMEMPPIGKGERLTEAQVKLIEDWINEGARWSGGTPERKARYSVSPSIRAFWVEGNELRFREQSGHWNTLSGGATRFSLSEQTGPDRSLRIEGHAMAGVNDYALSLNWQPGEGHWWRAGVEHWRRFYDNTGLFQPGAAPPPRLGLEPVLDLGRAWIEYGRQFDNGALAVLGYEYRFKDGAKSMLTLGPAGGIGVAPSYKAINEDRHRIRLDLQHEWKDTSIRDEFRLEFYALDTTHYQSGDTLNAVSADYSARNRTDQWVGANTFRLSRQIREGWHASGAYHYSRLRADNALSVGTTGVGTGFPEPRWSANSILNQSETHAFSLSSLFGPWNHLSLAPAFQAEWNRRRSAAAADIGYIFGGAVTPVPVALDASRDERITTESLTLRYTGIPTLSLSADLRLRQEAQGIFEQQQGGDAGLDPFATKNPSFLQRTDGDAAEQSYQAGMRWSPRPGWSLSTRLRHREKETGYRNELLALSGAGGPSSFPGFIRRWEHESDEIRSRLSARLRRGWRMHLTWQFTRGDYTIVTGASPADPGGGGVISASNSDAHTIGMSHSFTPHHRWNLSADFSVTDSRTVSAQNNVAGVAAWRGLAWSGYAHAGFVWNERTDLVATYSFSAADFGQPLVAGRVVQGTDYTLHGVRAGLRRRVGKRARLAIEYGLQRYDEPTSGGQTDYTAHGLFASINLPWPRSGAEKLAASQANTEPDRRP